MNSGLGGTVDDFPCPVETGTVAGAVPGFILWIPAKLAAQVRASGRHQMEGIVRILINSSFLSVYLSDAAGVRKKRIGVYFLSSA